MSDNTFFWTNVFWPGRKLATGKKFRMLDELNEYGRQSLLGPFIRNTKIRLLRYLRSDFV